jgi:membrane fusion protein (multidrug efflux system)
MTVRRIGRTVLVLAFVAGVGGAVYWTLLRDPATAPGTESVRPEETPVAKVKVVPLKEGTINVTVTAFGTVEAAQGGTEAFSVPFESRVTHVLVVGGQQVESEDPLVELEPSPDTQLRLEQAYQERNAAKNQRDLARQRLEMKLSTRQDLLQAEQTLAAAELLVQSMESRGMARKQTIRANVRGIVSRVDVQQGQIVPAGAALVETIEQGQIVVRLGLESEEVSRVQAGQGVRIEPVHGLEEGFEGKILRITREVNPQTRLVGVYIAPAAGARLLLNEYVRGCVVIESKTGLVVPSEAVLPEDGSHVLYTVEDGHAVKREVEPGPENEDRTLVRGNGLQAGQQVVTVGNSQLEDGMAVDVQGAP